VFNPRFLGWFLNSADSRQLVTFAQDWLLKLLNMSQVSTIQFSCTFFVARYLEKKTPARLIAR
jgi:hypothetical protein